MRLILYVAMIWLAVSIPVGLFFGRLCALQDQEQWPGEAPGADVPTAEADLVPVYPSFTRSAAMDAAQS